MKVRDLMTREVVSCGMDTPVSEIVSAMQQNKIHQIPVISAGDKFHKEGEVIGIVTANSIIRHESAPRNSRAETVMASTAKISPDADIKTAAKLIIDSDLRALPVWDGDLLGIVSEQDLMRAVQVEGALSDVARPAITVGRLESSAKVRTQMLQKNISRVIVIDKGKPVGVVGTLDLLGLIHGIDKSDSRGGRNVSKGAQEIVKLSSAPVENFMRPASIIRLEDGISRAVQLLQSEEEVVVAGESVLIVTPKDILRVYGTAGKYELVNIVGLEDEDPLTVEKIYESAKHTVQKISASASVQPMKVHIKRHHKQGPKSKYSVKIELPTSLGTFSMTSEHGRSDKSFDQLLTIVQRALGDLERAAQKKKEMRQKPDRAWISSERAVKEEGLNLRERKIKKRR